MNPDAFWFCLVMAAGVAGFFWGWCCGFDRSKNRARRVMIQYAVEPSRMEPVDQTQLTKGKK